MGKWRNKQQKQMCTIEHWAHRTCIHCIWSQDAIESQANNGTISTIIIKIKNAGWTEKANGWCKMTLKPSDRNGMATDQNRLQKIRRGIWQEDLCTKNSEMNRRLEHFSHRRRCPSHLRHFLEFFSPLFILCLNGETLWAVGIEHRTQNTFKFNIYSTMHIVRYANCSMEIFLHRMIQKLIVAVTKSLRIISAWIQDFFIPVRANRNKMLFKKFMREKNHKISTNCSAFE